MTVHPNRSKEDTAAAVETTSAAFAGAQGREAGVDTKLAQALAAGAVLQAAQDALAGRVVNGSGVSAEAAGKASAAIVENNEHVALLRRAKEIAAVDVAAAEREFLDAQYSHELHVIKDKRLALAGKQRAMQERANDYAQSVEECRDAGESLLISQRDALARRKHAPVGWYGGEFDQSLTAVRFLARSLPGWMLQILREQPLDHASYFAIADMTAAEAAK